ncbi:MAG: hypothetical protein II375_01060 [Bacteroidales bacterium]|nr:hypothetical protein [Bacteroidales bacterium]
MASKKTNGRGVARVVNHDPATPITAKHHQQTPGLLADVVAHCTTDDATSKNSSHKK